MMIETKRSPILTFIGIGLMLLCGTSSPACAQKVKQELPLIVGGEMPLYPIMARAARISGVVKIKVTTDGKNVTSADVVSGPSMLARFAKENVLTWKFSGHRPATFVSTFEYVIEGLAQCDYANDTLTLNLPLELRIIAPEIETCDPATTTTTVQP